MALADAVSRTDAVSLTDLTPVGDVIGLAVVVVSLLAGLWLSRNIIALPITSPPRPPGTADTPPHVSVIVPARNEAAILPGLLDSIAQLDPPVAEIVVVDDESQDGTGEIARRQGARVLSPDPRPPGWTGKAWACYTGATHTRGSLLLFLDADTHLAPEALTALLFTHSRHGGLVSVQPFHETTHTYEHLSAYFNAVAMLGSAAASHTEAGGAVMAFGPCLLTSRVDYNAVGGHAKVHDAILDDVELGAAYSRAGLSVTAWAGGRQVTMRSYPQGLSHLVAGWTKNIASGAGSTPRTLGIAIGLWVAGHHVAAVGALGAAFTLVSTPYAAGRLWWVLAWALAYVVVATQLRGILAKLGTFAWWAWALYPIPLLFFDALFAISAARTYLTRSVTWRGRAVPLRPRRGPR